MGKSQPHCDLFYRPVVFCLVLLLCRKKLQSWSDRVNEVHFPRGCIPQEVESGYDVTSCEQIFAKSGRPRDLILYFCFQCGKPFCMYMRQDWRKWKRFHCQTLIISPLGSTKAYLESQMMSQFLSWLPRETYQVAVFIILSASKI